MLHFYLIKKVEQEESPHYGNKPLYLVTLSWNFYPRILRNSTAPMWQRPKSFKSQLSQGGIFMIPNHDCRLKCLIYTPWISLCCWKPRSFWDLKVLDIIWTIQWTTEKAACLVKHCEEMKKKPTDASIKNPNTPN